MSESFLLSNMVPQVGVGFNRGIWRVLEDKVRDWSLERGEGWVVVGPVFQQADGVMKFQLIGKNHVTVPTHNFMKRPWNHKPARAPAPTSIRGSISA